jgi:hypothetical protein
LESWDEPTAALAWRGVPPRPLTEIRSTSPYLRFQRPPLAPPEFQVHGATERHRRGGGNLAQTISVALAISDTTRLGSSFLIGINATPAQAGIQQQRDDAIFLLIF